MVCLMQMVRARLLRLLSVASLPMSYALFLSGGMLCAHGAEPTPPTLLTVEVDRGTVTVDIRNARLAQVLRVIGERAGIEVTVRGDVSRPLTQSFAGVPLEEGLRRLTRGYSLVLTHAAAPGTSRAHRLTRVWVLGDASTPDTFAAATPTPEPLAEPRRQAHRPLGGSSQAARHGVLASARTSEAVRESQGAEWTQAIQMFTDAADRGSEAAVALLGDIIASEADAAVRLQAVAALGRLTGVVVEPVLTDALGDTDVAVRVRAIRGLRGVGTDTAVQSLTAVMIGDPAPQVRLAAVRALVALPSRTMFHGLEQAALDPDVAVRDTAARGLSWWHMHRRDLE